jgi:hypothetical protein
MDRGTRRFTTSSPASAGLHAQTPGVHRGSFVQSSFWHACRSLVGTRRPCRRLRSLPFEPRPVSLPSVKKKSKWPIRCAFLRQDARATERQVDPDPDLAVEDALRERPRSGPTDSHFVVESARADILRCRPRVSPSTRAPAYPFAGRPVTVGTGLRRARAHLAGRTRATEFQTGFSGLVTAYRVLQRMFDARARPRAVNPPPREAACLCPRCRGGGCPSPPVLLRFGPVICST